MLSQMKFLTSKPAVVLMSGHVVSCELNNLNSFPNMPQHLLDKFYFCLTCSAFRKGKKSENATPEQRGASSDVEGRKI